ncbi:hypothetical protein JAAARDRAFT_81798 [Jaapia argillacea MUCL 33604]|uniref:MYND-type domain-containing protein n=1 Tax=Jaapia argillacea MUCL 33604 TaxID=933084 RepID=A0A067PA96_9AGAM|nr:hypothetical protein JAAARDRAFT_81798 [Jaapia argillacea MUCL 33604]
MHYEYVKVERPFNMKPRQDIKQNLASLPMFCWCCNEGKSRADLKVCSRCKTARYCTTECQKRDWPKHKEACLATPLQWDRGCVKKMAERFLANDAFMSDLSFFAAITLKLHEDPTNATRYGVQLICSAIPVEPSPGSSTARTPSQVMFHLKSIKRMPIDECRDRETPLMGQIEQVHKDMTMAGANGDPVVMFDLRCFEEDGEGARMAQWLRITRRWTETVKKGPPTLLLDPILGSMDTILTPEFIHESINAKIRRDKDNKLKLRARKA